MNYYTIKMSSKTEYNVDAKTMENILKAGNNLITLTDYKGDTCVLNKAHFVDAFINKELTEHMNRVEKTYEKELRDGKVVMVEKLKPLHDVVEYKNEEQK